MSKLTKLLGAVAAVLTLHSGLSFAQSASTDYTYDARGRLVKVENASGDVSYSYDNAGNRTSVTATNAPPTGAPVIDYFLTPSKVRSGNLFNVSWQSSLTTSCQIAVSAAGTSLMATSSSGSTNYPNLATSGTLFLQINQESDLTLTCTNGSQSVSVSRNVDIDTSCDPRICGW